MKKISQHHILPPFVAGVLTTLAVMLLGLFWLGRLDKAEATSPSSSSSVSASSSLKSSSSSSSTSVAASSQTRLEPSPAVDNGGTVPSSTSVQAPVAAPVLNMQVDAIANGDFSSVEGRWMDGYGSMVEFSKTGVVGEGHSILILELLDRGSLRTNYTQGRTGLMLEFFPAGVSGDAYLLDQEKAVDDPSDKSRDRLWMGQSLDGVADPKAYFYKQ